MVLILKAFEIYDKLDYLRLVNIRYIYLKHVVQRSKSLELLKYLEGEDVGLVTINKRIKLSIKRFAIICYANGPIVLGTHTIHSMESITTWLSSLLKMIAATKLKKLHFKIKQNKKN